MKEQKLRLLLGSGLMALLVLLAAILPVKAQSGFQVRATVPFDFIVGDEGFPAGDYSLRAHTTAQGVLVIREWDEATSLMFLALSSRNAEPKEKGRLVFRRYEDQYFLYQVWMAGEASGYELPKSRTERSVEKDLAKNQSDRGDVRGVEIVTITSNP